MARSPRIQFPGAFYHVMSRGALKQNIFLGDDDRSGFLKVFADVVATCAWSCYAYCLMDNHYHLLIETAKSNFSHGMHKLNSDYCNGFNRKYEKVGHVMQGRFQSLLVERDEHLQELVRYIVLNPVRGGLVSEPGHWRWSSYLATGGLVPAPGFLDVNYTLGLFGDDPEIARQSYLRFVAEGLLPDQTSRITLQELFRGVRSKHRRNRTIQDAYLEHGYTITEIAAYLKLNRSTVSRAMEK